MREFFVSLFCAAVAGGLCTALAGKPYEKHIKYIAALVFTVMVVSPLLSFVAKPPPENPTSEQISVDSNAAEQLVIKQLCSDSEEALAAYIFSETGIKADHVGIQIESVEDEYKVVSITVKLDKDGDCHAVKSCIEALHGGDIPTEVTK